MDSGSSQITDSIVFGAGCFWCTEAVFTRVRGVVAVESGYCNGHVLNPTYEQICTGTTGHAEVVKVDFRPDEVSLETLIEIFFATHDPTTLNRQGNDVGTQYRSGIYFHSPAQAAEIAPIVERIKADNDFGAPIVTEVQPCTNYSRAEEYHQRYFERNPHQGYCAAVIAPKVSKFRGQYQHLLKG